MMTDRQTVNYFDSFMPHFKARRLEFAFEYIKNSLSDGQSLLDIGCGDGTVLADINEKITGLNLSGMDVSSNCLKIASEKVKFQAICGSVTDDEIIISHAGKYDYIILAAVLHHLVGPTRKSSYRNARKCLHNCQRLLKSNGYLFLYEPAFSPSIAMDIVFWVKRMVGSVWPGRIELKKQWLNIGQPVVSYYTQEKIESFITAAGDFEIAEKFEVNPRRTKAGIIKRVGLGYIVRKRPI